MFDFKKLLQVGVHFGHKTSFGNPKMRPYIWGAKNKIHLIDVSKTAVLLEHAGKVLKDVVSNGKSVLWIGTKNSAHEIIEKAGKDLQMPYVVNRWIGGTLSNYSQVKKAITRLLHLRDVQKKSGSFYTKKEMVMLEKQVARLEKNVGGIVGIEFPPAAIVVVDAKKEHSAVKEAHGMGIPVIALVDTNTDPSFVNHVIPGNDDSPKAIAVIVEYLASCAAEGKALAATRKVEEKEKEVVVKKDEEKEAMEAKLALDEESSDTDKKPRKASAPVKRAPRRPIKK